MIKKCLISGHTVVLLMLSEYINGFYAVDDSGH